jgi:hypothetical protein
MALGESARMPSSGGLRAQTLVRRFLEVRTGELININSLIAAIPLYSAPSKPDPPETSEWPWFHQARSRPLGLSS